MKDEYEMSFEEEKGRGIVGTGNVWIICEFSELCSALDQPELYEL